MKPLSFTMQETLRLFPLYGWRWDGAQRQGFWISMDWLRSDMPKYSGSSTLRALEERGLAESRLLAPYRSRDSGKDETNWEEGEWFYRLTHAGVLERAALSGVVNWK